MIKNIEDFTNIELYDEMVSNGEKKQSKEELEAIIDEYNANVGIFKKKSKSMLMKAYDMNWNMSEKKLMNEFNNKKHEEAADVYKKEFEEHEEEIKQSLGEMSDVIANETEEFKKSRAEIKAEYEKSKDEIKKEHEKTKAEIKNDLKNQKYEKELKLEQKFGIQFQNRTWFECAIEEKRFSTIFNNNNRDVQHAYVFVEPTFLEIIKESVFLKSKMGARKVYFENVAGIDYDARGRLHLSNNLIINLKSSEYIQLKNITEDWAQHITDKYEQYLSNNNNNAQPREMSNDVDDLMKYAELLEKGLITKEEFDIKKAEIMGTSNVSKTDASTKFCSNCGNPIEVDSKFCPNCGTQL